jgi:ribosomal protein L13E
VINCVTVTPQRTIPQRKSGHAFDLKGYRQRVAAATRAAYNQRERNGKGISFAGRAASGLKRAHNPKIGG